MEKVLKKFLKKNKAKRIISIFLVVILVLGLIPIDNLSPAFDNLFTLRVHAAANSRKANLTFNDLTDFVAYSVEYQSNAESYSEDTITLTINSGEYHTLSENFKSLGTSEWPFNGKIYITATYGDGWYFNTDKPLFDYITDTVTINYAIEEHNTEPIPIEIRRKFVDSTSSVALSPLFAQHITDGAGDSASWSIKATPYIDSQDNVNTYNFSGLIGTMENNAQVSVNFVNDSYYSVQGIHSNIQGTGDIGLICGTMNQGSAINLTLSGTNTYCDINCNIESNSAGNAGGLIGTMQAGSVLTINSSSYVPDSNRIVKTTSGCAGGLVGYSDGGLIQFPTPGEGEAAVCTSIPGTVEGTIAAGGLYGYYSNPVTVSGETITPQNVTFDMSNYDIDCTVKATAAGGLFGMLSSTADIRVDGNTTGANEITITGDTVTNFGGIAGTYQTNALANSFQIDTVTANTSATFTGTSYYGGVCGQIAGSEAAYIDVSSLTHKSSAGYDAATAFGGVVGNAGDKGSMLDVGSVTIETGVVEGTAANGTAYKGGGIVGVLTDGVLRLSGTTDLTKAPSAPATNDPKYKESGQLVGIRTNSLVYATGSGNSGDTNWIFNRSTTRVNADDIATWGSVIRISNVETDVLTFDPSAHTVTVKAPVTTITSPAEYTKTALNMQLNSGDKGALKFADSTNKKSVLLATDISFSGTIELSGTGNIGLMRDDYKDSIDEIGAYTKTISGGTVNLAIGERYGSVSTSVGRGDIIAHRYNGLVARTGETTSKETVDGKEETIYTPATISGVTIGGIINVNATIDGTHVGGAVSDAPKGITLTNVTAQETINFNKISGSSHIVGGIVADVSGGNTGISGGTAKPKISLTGNVGGIPIGGAIGKITNTGKTITASSLTVSADIDASGASGTDVSCVGFISEISGGSMNLTGITVNGTNIKNCASGDSSHAGGFLGMKWLGTNVNFTANNGIILSGTNTLSTSAKYAAGLVQYATGHWTVPEKGISITGMSISNVTNSLGLIVHDGYFEGNGLYLELTHKDSFDLGAGLTIPETTYYDELVRSTGSDILKNSVSNRGNGIISITTDGDLIMDGSSCNTYQNKYNKGNLSNSSSRYYYNLTSIGKKTTKSDGEKLLLWSLKKYAASNISSSFNGGINGTTLTGTFDLEHLSYYPIDVDSGITIGDATFKFYNDKIEASEDGTGDSDDGVRTTRGASQHYLMHSGVFKNVSSTLTTDGNIHFQGSVGANATYSGVLVNGTLSGTLTTSGEKEIVLEGITISDDSQFLLINKLTTNSKLTLSGVRTGGGQDFSNVDKSSEETRYEAGATVASSLIGDVSGNGIQISFERLKLDARTTAGSPRDWSGLYGTTKSIFSGATLLNKFEVDNNSIGTYNFDEELDWKNEVHNANVTYGQEIKTSVEYANKQQKYLDQVHYVYPTTDPSTLANPDVYPFDTGFLPYVKESTATSTGTTVYTTREIKVNVKVEGLSEGCGTYNHPYQITSGEQLVNVANAINKTAYPDKLRLPKIQGTNYASAISTHWCENKTSCAVFDHGSGNYTYTEGGTTYTWTEDQVSLYLASAYYIIQNDITITGAYSGLGASPANDSTGKYAFRGVIVGAKSDGTIKISMSVSKPTTPEVSGYENPSGLITMSNGCVVKNLTINVTPYATDKYNYKVSGNQAYGYNEKFPNYGAVINKIMGGDNIIDNVSVNYNGKFKVVNTNDYKATIGGYVGCVVNGGLIFRNVSDSNLKTTTVTNVNGVETRTTAQGFKVIKVNGSGVQQQVKIGDNVICSSAVDGSMTDERDLIHIHINPFVGRVINGYAIRETDSYGFSEDGATYGDGEARANAVEVTMHNTRKNYSIPDIDSTKNYQNDVKNSTKNVLTFSKETGETSYNTITVPDSQALYIMSIIAQSGAGCASTETANYAYNISYCGNTKNRSYAGTIEDNNKTTHKANYSNVGTATSTEDSDYSLSILDEVGGRTAVPYIIYKYTSSYNDGGTKYPARTLTQRTFYVNLVGGTTYYLPDSFRGIGFLGSNTLDDNMKIYGFNGNGTENSKTVIDVNTEYFVNQQDLDPYFGNNINAVYSVGIGLFNNLKQSSSTGFDSKYESDSKYQITNFTLQGYLSAHHVNKDNGSDENAAPQGNRNGKFMDTAGFVPIVLFYDATVYNFSNILFKNLHINSYAYAGGFVAYTNGPNNQSDHGVMIYINNCNADGFKIEGSGRVAGFVGSYDTNRLNTGIHINTGLDTSGKDSFTSVMKNTIINNKFSGDTKHNYTAGILGSVWFAKSSNTLPSDNGDNAKGHLILRNVTIEGGNAETNYIGNRDNPSGSSGGIIGGGSSKVNGCLIQNCIVKDIDIYGKYAGGIMGEDANRNSGSSNTGARIVGCTVTGKLDENSKPQYTIMGLYYAGGVYGDTRDTNTSIHPQYKSVSAGNTSYVTYKTDIDGVYIYGYNIFSVNTANDNNAFDSDNGRLKTRVAAGGLIGSNNENRYIQNCKVEKCVIDVGTNADSATNTPCGGIVGQMNKGTLYGFNIEVKDCDFLTHQWVLEETVDDEVVPAHATNTQKAYTYTDEDEVVHNPVSGMNCGNFIGNGNSKTVNLTAVHSENNPASVDFYGVASASFIVYADYLDAASEEDHGTEMSALRTLTKSGTTYAEAGEGGLKDYFPHVNVSPVTSMGSTAFLTSDGAAVYSKSGTDTPVVDAIITGGKYTTAGNTASSAITSALSENDDANKISTYYTEMGSLPEGVDDFAVVVINTENKVDSTNIINNYIQMVTNTSASYTNDIVTGKYVINVYPCTFSGGNYVINAEGKTAGLYYSTDSNQYYMQNGYADSNQEDYQFSLIDVQFLNPDTTNHANEIVYHLYVPVLTRKMMMFGFKSASLSGTDVILDNFDNYGNTLAEGLKSWYTGYVHFTYPVSELQNLLDNGTGLNWNSSKTLQLKYTTSDVSSKLSGNTQIVLVDPYGSDKYYYSKLSSLRPETDTNGSVDNIALSGFNSQLDGNGTDFAPTSILGLMSAQGFSVTAQTGTANAPGYYYKDTTDPSKAAITIGGTMYEYVGENASGNVKLTINAPANAEMSGGTNSEAVLKEDYYLCLRAEGNRVYNYSIRTPATIAGGAGAPSLRVSNLKENEITNIIMGDLYQQTVTIGVQNNGTNNLVIDSTNHQLDVNLRTTITLLGSNDDKDFILNHLSSGNINLYQAFVLTLTARDSTGERVEILGEPDITATYTINGSPASPANGAFNKYSGSYILLNEHDIKNSLSKSDATIVNAIVHINFDEAWKYNQEFPTQDGSDSTIGVNVSAKSNLSYNTDSLLYTNMTASPASPNPNYYYVKESEGAELVYNYKSGILDEYDEAGYSSFNYSQQGVNPKKLINPDQTRIPMETVATYDASSVKRSEFASAKKVKYKLKLYKKMGDVGSVMYVEVGDAADYIDLSLEDSVFIKVNSGVTAGYASGGKMNKTGSNEFTYIADINQTAFSRQEDQMFDADIDFTVITGEDNTEYANYRFVLSVDLLDENNNPVNATTSAHDWVVYTNAKINPNMLSASEAPY